MVGYFRFVLQHRWVVLALTAAVTLVAFYFISQAVVASTIKKQFFGDSPMWERYQKRVREFTSDVFFVIAYEEEELFEEKNLEKLEKALDPILEMEHIERTDSLLNAQRAWRENGGLRVSSFARLAETASPAAALAAIQSDELIGSLLISNKADAAAVLVELVNKEDLPGEVVPQVVGEALGYFEAAGFERSDLHVVGFPAVLAEMTMITYNTFQSLFPITTMLLLATVLLLFRRLSPAFVSTGIALIAVTWTVGLAAFIDRELSIFVGIVPIVIMVVSFSDVVHLWSAYLIELRSGKSKQEAIEASAVDVGTACLLTSVTTFLGFACLSMVPTPMFRQLGLVLGFGVAAALFLAMTLVPIVLSLMKEPKLDSPAIRSRKDDLMERTLSAMHHLTSHRPWLVIISFVALLGASGVGISRMTIDTDLASRLDDSNPSRIDQRFFDDRFASDAMLDIFIEAPKRDGLLDPDTFARVVQFEQKLEALPEVDAVIAWTDLIRRLHHQLGGEGELPTTRAALAQYLLVFEMSGGKEVDRMIDFERQTSRMSLRLNLRSFRETTEFGDRAQKLGESILGSSAKVEATGITYLMGWWLDEIVVGQQRGVALSFVLISIMMMIGLRSFRVGLWSMLPNAIPLIALGGYLGFFFANVDSDTFIVGMMAIGIGVDDTIHFLMRYRIEAERTDTMEALRRTFTFAGRAIVMTTVILVIGFSPFATSDYYSMWMLGTMIPGVLIMALAADLLLVPALVQVGFMRYRGPQNREAAPKSDPVHCRRRTDR